MAELVSGTQPATGGIAELSGVVAALAAVTVPTIDSVSTTGTLVLAQEKPVLSDVQAFGQLDLPAAIDLDLQIQWFELLSGNTNAPAAPATRQILIR